MFESFELSYFQSRKQFVQFRSLSEQKFFKRTINQLHGTRSPQVIDSPFEKIYLRQALRLTPFPPLRILFGVPMGGTLFYFPLLTSWAGSFVRRRGCR